MARAGDRNGQAAADEKKLAVIRRALEIVHNGNEAAALFTLRTALRISSSACPRSMFLSRITTRNAVPVSDTISLPWVETTVSDSKGGR